MWWPLVRFLCGILRHSDCMMLLGWLAVQNPLLQWNVGIVPKQLYVCTHAFPRRGQSAPGKGQVAHNRTAHSHTTEHSLPQEQAKLLKTEQHIPTPQSTVCPRNRPKTEQHIPTHTEHSLPQEQAKLLKTEQHIPTHTEHSLPQEQAKLLKTEQHIPTHTEHSLPQEQANLLTTAHSSTSPPPPPNNNNTHTHTKIQCTVCPRNRSSWFFLLF